MFKLIGLCSSAFALAVEIDGDKGGYSNGPWDFIFAILSILIGALLIFSGLKVFRATLFILGFFFFSNLSYGLLLRYEPAGGYGQRTWILLLVPFAIGILGGILSRTIWKFGISLAGFLGGMTVAMMILGVKENGLIENDVARLIFIIVFGIAGAVLVNIFEKPSLIGGTSLIGSYALFFGLDYFLKTGFRATVKGLLTGTTSVGEIQYQPTAVLLMLAGVVVFTGVGIAYQYRTTRDLKYRD
ncbi:hypothetical protein BC833DRAFT_625349 [Globomyces pollinis-pini]|nr:hypothetical protein BC833DRAFT_625349 [Globomyces pollinis-pini]